MLMSEFIGKKWLKEHEHALDDWEPTIEIKRPDGRKLPVNGNYKPGMIREFMKSKEGKLKCKIQIVPPAPPV